MLLIKNLYIKNFRSIRDSGEITNITKIFALIGRNNTGKSSILKAIQILLNKRSVDINDFYKDTTENIEISGTLEKGFGKDVETLNLKVVCEKEDLKTTYSINGEKLVKIKFAREVPELLSIDDIRNPEESTTGGQKTTLLKQILKLQETTKNEKIIDLSQQIEDLKRQESEEVSNKLSEKFRSVVKEKSYSVFITPEVNLEKGVTYKTEVIDGDIPRAKKVDILNSGTGLQSMYILTLLEVFAEMSTEQGEVILIVEEPEVYLHPEYQRRMFAALRRIAERSQVIFTTHSPIMISDIWLTESVRQIRLNEEGETQIEGVKIENVIDELGIRYEDVLNPSLVVFVEGEKDIKFFRKLGIDDSKLIIISTDGFRAIHYFAFIKIISSEHVKNKFILIADSDGEKSKQREEYLRTKIFSQFTTPPKRLEEILERSIFVLDRYSIESYFIDKTTLRKAFPELDGDNIDSFVDQYEEKYKEKTGKLLNGSLALEDFRKYLKPKLIFEVLKNDDFKKAYKDFWSGKDIFLVVKDLIAQRRNDIGARGEDPFEHVLNSADLIAFPELVKLRELVLSNL